MDNARAAWELSRVRDLHVSSAVFALLALWVTALSLVATAASAATNDPAELYDRAEREDEDLSFERAMRSYEEALRAQPSNPRAMRAEARVAIFRARSEGNFEPLAKLERIRRDPTLASDEAAIDELARSANAFPPGLVRVEARVLVAEAYAHRLGRPEDAAATLRLVIADPRAERIIAQKAARDLATISLSRGDLAGARAAVALAGDRADPKLEREIARAARRRSMHLASIGLLVGIVVLALVASVRAVRAGRREALLGATRRMSRLAIAYAAYVAIAGGLLASGYEEGTSRPFLLFGATLAPLLLLARAWGAAAAQSRAARVFRAVLCATGAVAAGFLVLEHVDVRYLEGLGL
jgi:hypothetical protein